MIATARSTSGSSLDPSPLAEGESDSERGVATSEDGDDSSSAGDRGKLQGFEFDFQCKTTFPGKDSIGSAVHL